MSEEKVFVRVDMFQQMQNEGQAYRYCKELNITCMPLMRKLGIKDVKLIVKFCSLGGKQRLREYMEQNTQSNAVEAVAYMYYEKILEEFPLFKEIANNWKWNRHLVLNEDMTLGVKEETIEEMSKVYISGKNIEFLDNMNKLCDCLNSFLKFGQIEYIDPFIFLSRIITYNYQNNTWEFNTMDLSDDLIERYTSLLSKSEFYDKIARKQNEIEQKEETEGKKYFDLN